MDDWQVQAMLLVQVPSTYQSERRYIFHVLLKEFLGLDYHLETQPRNTIRLTANDGKELLLPDIFFQTPAAEWLTSKSLPQQPLPVCNTPYFLKDCPLTSENIPVIYGTCYEKNSPLLVFASPASLHLAIDIFGSAFFMLTRYEEVVKTEQDNHKRFPANASLAYQEKFLERPIINEYLEILWWCLKQLWPDIERKPRRFRLIPSHDVDHPFYYALQSQKWIGKTILGDLFTRKDPWLAAKRIQVWSQVKAGYPHADPYYTFDWLMDQSEHVGTNSAFYMMAAQPGAHDEGYDLSKAPLRSLLRQIAQRGHEIGVHASYASFLNPTLLKKEVDTLRRILDQEGIQQAELGGRQHYLRWKAPDTWQHWVEAGLSYDSTLTFAEYAGFRMGICYEYPVFDLTTRQMLPLWERPLLVMDATIFSPYYMGLSPNQALQYIKKLAQYTQQYHGTFIILWHNDWFYESEAGKAFYQSVIKTCTNINGSCS